MSDQEERDALDLDENGCAPDCPIRILGEQSGERKSAYPDNPMKAAEQSRKNYAVVRNDVYGERISQSGTMTSDTGKADRYFAQFYPDSSGELDENGCAPDCPIRILGEQSGERPTGAVTKTVGEPTKNHEVYGKHTRRTHYERTSSAGKADRYFAQFYPDSDETHVQERGETQLLKSDEVKSANLPIDQVIHGDCREVLKTLAPNSIDAIVCDPPAGIAFMGKDWDAFDGKKHRDGAHAKERYSVEGKWLEGRGTSPYGFGDTSMPNSSKSREAFIAFMTEVFSLAIKCLKPGGHAFVWALPRTSHWTATALENAGFEIRDEVSHLFATDSKVQTFVASLDEEQRNAFAQIVDNMGAPAATLACFGSGFPKSKSLREIGRPELGSALKPSHETWWLVRKPLAATTSQRVKLTLEVLATWEAARYDHE